MKKINYLISIVLLALTSLVLVSCSSFETIRLLTPGGAPGVGSALLHNKEITVEGKKYKVSVDVTEPDKLKEAFTKQEYDFINAPINLGVNFGAKYELASKLTGGNVFLVSKGELVEGSLPGGRTIYSFFDKGKSVNSLLLENPKIFGSDFRVEVKDVKTELLPLLIKSTDEIFVIAEPQLTLFKAAHSDITLNEIDLYTSFSSQYSKSFLQAATFVNKNLDKKIASAVLDALKDSSAAVNDDARFNAVFNAARDLGVIPAQLSSVENAKTAFKRSHIEYQDGETLKSAFKDLVDIAKTSNSSIFKKQDGTYWEDYNSFFTKEA